MDDEEPKTPRETGSRPRWPIHAARCIKAAEMLDALAAEKDAAALKKEKVIFSLDRRGAQECRSIARQARDLAVRCRSLVHVFEEWERTEVGLEKRMEAIGRMYNLAREARVLGVIFPGTN